MTIRTTTDIAHATAADVPVVGDALASAFHDDPVFTWLVPDPADRRARFPSLFGLFAEAFLPLRETYVTGNGTGAALWEPAGVHAIGDDEAETFGERLGAVMGEHAERAFELQGLLDEGHPDEPCWFLQFVGVRTEHQGQGLGSRLLATVLDRCDDSGAPAYLDATSPSNRRLYERHGFEVVRELRLPEGPPLWSMWRDPAPRGA